MNRNLQKKKMKNRIDREREEHNPSIMNLYKFIYKVQYKLDVRIFDPSTVD